jgi:hypothetical protein
MRIIYKDQSGNVRYANGYEPGKKVPGRRVHETEPDKDTTDDPHGEEEQ